MSRAAFLFGYLFAFVLSAAAHAQSATPTSGVMVGRVLDASTESPLGFASVILMGSTHGVLTLQDGRFRIEGVATGRHRVQAAFAGLHPAVREVQVQAGQETAVEFRMQRGATATHDMTGPCITQRVTPDEDPLSHVVLRTDAVRSPHGEMHVRCGGRRSIAAGIEPAYLPVVIEVVRSQVRSGQLVQLDIHLENMTDFTVRVPRDYRIEEATILVEVLRDGERLQRPHMDAYAVKLVDLGPGEQRSYRVTLNDKGGYAFDTPGRYAIRVQKLFNVSMWPAATEHTVHIR